MGLREEGEKVTFIEILAIIGTETADLFQALGSRQGLLLLYRQFHSYESRNLEIRYGPKKVCNSLYLFNVIVSCKLHEPGDIALEFPSFLNGLTSRDGPFVSARRLGKLHVYRFPR